MSPSPAPSGRPARARHPAVTWLAVPVLLAVVGLFAYRALQQGFDWGRFRASLTNLHWHWLAASTAVILFTYWCRALRWEVMLRPLVPHPNRYALFSSTVIGFTAIVLFGRAGELVRPYLISVRERVPFSSQLAAWLLERIFDLLMVGTLFGFALSQADRGDASLGPKARLLLQTGGTLVGIIGVACLAALLALGRYAGRVGERLREALAFLPERHRERLGGTIASFSQGMEVAGKGHVLGALAAWTVVEWALILVAVVFLFWAFPAVASFSVLDILLFLGFVSFGSAVQVPGVGGGMQLAAIVILTEFFHQPIELATSLALVLWVVSFVTVLPFGLLLALRDGLSWRSLRHVEDAVPVPGEQRVGEARPEGQGGARP